jgi:outer membrane protein TolC
MRILLGSGILGCVEAKMKLLLLISMFPTLILAGEPAPATVSLDAWVGYASARFAAGAGREERLAAEGLADVLLGIGGRLETLDLEVVPETGVAGNELSRGETTAKLALTFPLRSWRKPQKSALRAESSAAAWSFLAARERFVLQGFELFARAFEEHHIRQHLTAVLSDTETQYQHLSQLVEKGAASRIDLLEQRLLLGRLREEVNALSLAYEHTLDQLAELMGEPVEPIFPVWQEDVPELPNPWPGLRARVDDFAALKAIELAQQAASSAATAEYARTGIRLSPLLQWREEPDGRAWLGGGLSLALPLQPRRGEQYRRHRLREKTLDARFDWQRTQLLRGLTSMERAHARHQQHLRYLAAEVLSPLEERLELLEQAWRAGQVDVRRLAAARLEFHEAEHDLLRQAFAVWRSNRHAGIVQQVLTSAPNTMATAKQTTNMEAQ